MRLTVMLDEKLIDEALRLSGTKTINEVISIALQEFVTTRKQFLKMIWLPHSTLTGMLSEIVFCRIDFLVILIIK